MPLIPLSEFTSRLDDQVSFLRDLVGLESPSTDKPGIDRLGEFLADRLSTLGARIQRLPQEVAGDHWMAEWGEGPEGILLLAHLDTVYPVGTLARMPWRREEGLLRGPGVLDMKASLAMAVVAVDILRRRARLPARRITLLCTSDEEVGSHTSRELIETQARRHDLVLCLEPALPDGSLKTERKGVGIYRLRASGRAAHAGSNPEQGINAILEMAHQVLRIQQLAEAVAGATLNVGVIHGGTRSNVIPEACTARLDLRVDTEQDA
jgi:glutamate carboxypeptidase